MTLNQQPKEVSKRNTPLISHAATVQEQEPKKLPVNLRYGVIIQHLSGPMDAGLKEFYCTCLGCIMQTNKII